MTEEKETNVTNAPNEAENAVQGEINPLEAQLSKAQEDLAQEKNKYLYLYADYENYKKRAIKERSDLLKYGSEYLARDLLLVKDNFERAMSHTENAQALISGLELVNEELKKTLERFGIKEIKSVGEKFDPTSHEAIEQVEGDQEGMVMKEFQKGYRLHDRTLRFAKVAVSGAKKTNEESK